MADSLVQAYLPLLLWAGLGAILFQFLPDAFPRLLGRGLYWVGVPLEILALSRQTNLTEQTQLAPLLTIAALAIGLSLAGLSLQILQRRAAARQIKAVDSPEAGYSSAQQNPWQERSRQGSFLIASMLGNTGFVGLAIAPAFVGPSAMSWLVLYSVTQNVIGTYGMGVFLSSYFGRSTQTRHWWTQIRDVLTVPSLWAFTIGSFTRAIDLPPLLDTGLQASIWLVIPAALLLMGIRLRQLQGWKSLRWAIVPATIKSILLPSAIGLVATAMGLPAEPHLALVLMAGMPTAFAGLILAEEYELDRELIASSIVLTSGMLLFTLPIWLWAVK